MESCKFVIILNNIKRHITFHFKKKKDGLSLKRIVILPKKTPKSPFTIHINAKLNIIIFDIDFF